MRVEKKEQKIRGKMIKPMKVKDLLKAIKEYKLNQNCEILVEQNTKKYKVFDLGALKVTQDNKSTKFLLIDITKAKED